MSFRIEEKLFIKKENLFDFFEFIQKKNPKKPFKNRLIKSLYFDNNSLGMYDDSIEGLVPRKKIRVRTYPKSEDLNYYLEKKNSSVEGRFKTRKKISLSQFDEIKSFGFFDEQYGLCLPKLYVEYVREYLIVEDVRFSIDTNIKYTNYLNYFETYENNVIVELKCDYKKNLDQISEIFPFQKIRFSKYCFAIDALNLK